MQYIKSLLQPYTNETTPTILNYKLTMGDKEPITINGEHIHINTIASMTDIGLKLKLGKLNCFTLNAVNRLGLGEPSYSCTEG